MHKKGRQRSEELLLPPCLEDYVPKDHPVRFIDQFVDGLDLLGLGFRKVVPKREGRPPYDPSDLLKLFIYGYMNGVPSSRRLERQAQCNIEVKWLIRDLVPDFKPIARFRSENAEALRQVFQLFVQLGVKRQFFGNLLAALDGSRFKGVNSIDRVYTTAADHDKVVAVSQQALMRRTEIRHPELPFEVRVKKYYMNSTVQERGKDETAPPPATQGVGTRAVVGELPHTTEMDRRDVPSAVIELVTPQGSLGTWLVSEYINTAQPVRVGNRSFSVALRSRRYYKPYSIQSLEFRHDVYPGTDIPKNFSSRVLLNRPDRGEKREVLIYMNSPLR